MPRRVGVSASGRHIQYGLKPNTHWRGLDPAKPDNSAQQAFHPLEQTRHVDRKGLVVSLVRPEERLMAQIMLRREVEHGGLAMIIREHFHNSGAGGQNHDVGMAAPWNAT